MKAKQVTDIMPLCLCFLKPGMFTIIDNYHKHLEQISTDYSCLLNLSPTVPDVESYLHQMEHPKKTTYSHLELLIFKFQASLNLLLNGNVTY